MATFGTENGIQNSKFKIQKYGERQTANGFSPQRSQRTTENGHRDNGKDRRKAAPRGEL
jgi:hypothetical protein